MIFVEAKMGGMYAIVDTMIHIFATRLDVTESFGGAIQIGVAKTVMELGLAVHMRMLHMNTLAQCIQT